MSAINVLCAQLTRDVFAIAKFLLLVTSASDLPMRTNKLCSVLFGVPVDWYKRSRLLLLSTYSTVEICWRHSTLHQSSCQLSIVL